MKKYILLSSLALFVLLLYNCTNPKPIDDLTGTEYSKQVKTIIDNKNKQIQQWYATGMIDSVAMYFTEDCIQLPPNQPPLVGRDNLIKGWKQNIQFGKWIFDLRVQEVKASGDLATELGQYTLTFEPYENAPIPAMSDKGKYVVLWEKTEGDWKIVWDAPVSELPLPIPGSEPGSTDESSQE
ncbi:YybH family protein [Robertkochia solimangrovi]|uniref:YybH family protein n=1 Tax=Robertkochia solimangrovi TaxID=2213046 RepID=UPI00117E83C6|nr:DUF4440 domain-containing protein [Robertkochia solimangrovi]TRZ46346.1 hypothetical protein DMZ48_03575 [Robertkochia solimangrovi]